MTNFIYLEIDIFAVAVLATIYDYSNWKYLNLEQKLFNMAVLTTGCVSVFDGLSWIFDGIQAPYAGVLNIFFNYLYWFASILPGYFAMLYSLKKMKNKHYSLFQNIGAVIVVVATILIILNPFTKWIFDIDRANNYLRGPYFQVVGFLPFLYIGITMVVTIAGLLMGPRYERKNYAMFLLFMSFAFLGALPQIFVYGIVSIWISVAISLLMCYVYLQRGNVATDSLTKINNRRRFDAYAQYVCDHIQNEGENVYLVMMDLNKFKSINDDYGHAEGDRALCVAASVLQEVFIDGKTFFARIGGDEFAVIFHNTTEAYVEEMIAKLRQTVALKSKELPYDIRFAIGYAVSSNEHYVDFAKLFSMADQKMYKDKAKAIQVIPVHHVNA